jgi:uncharacterized protein YndB with AHSA1/START domain
VSSAVADLAEGTIHASIEIEATPEAVFDAMVEPEQLAIWWGSPETYRTSNWQVDLRPGGEWSAVAKGVKDGRSSVVRGRYLELERPRLLVYTWQPSWDDYVETTIRVELTETRTGTRVRVTHAGFGERLASATGHTDGWRRLLRWLDDHLRPLPKPSTA